MRPPLAYRLVSLGLTPLLLAHSGIRAARDGGVRYLRERHGFGPRVPGDPVWIHCASVGEVVTALPLVRELSEQGIGPLLLTTATPTGQGVATARLPAGVHTGYLPLDRPAPVRRFLERTRPRAALLLETELWPHLFAGVARRAIPIAIVNARLSRRTLEAPRWWRGIATWCVQRTAVVLARSRADAEGFERLGAEPERVQVIGNLKLAPPGGAAAEAIHLAERVVLAASTHDDEEVRIAEAWRSLGADGALLAIAPRHPERGAAIARALSARGLTVARRSAGDPPRPGPNAVYLADTLGELPSLIAGSAVVVMGGSFIPHGGQNVLEPARAGRPVVTGPHMENFAEETERLAEAGALQRCADVETALHRVAEWLADPDAAARAGAAGRELLAAEADVCARYRDALASSLGAAVRTRVASAVPANADDG